MGQYPATPENYKETLLTILVNLPDHLIDHLWSEYFMVHRLADPYDITYDKVLSFIQYYIHVHNKVFAASLDTNYHEELHSGLTIISEMYQKYKDSLYELKSI